MSTIAHKAGSQMGDFVAVHSTQHRKSVYDIIGDSGHSSGGEGSLALLQALGYPFRNGEAGEVKGKEIIVRYFPRSNPKHHFFTTQHNSTKRPQLWVSARNSERSPNYFSSQSSVSAFDYRSFTVTASISECMPRCQQPLPGRVSKRWSVLRMPFLRLAPESN
jgi:hypothetical protein